MEQSLTSLRAKRRPPRGMVRDLAISLAALVLLGACTSEDAGSAPPSSSVPSHAAERSTGNSLAASTTIPITCPAEPPAAGPNERVIEILQGCQRTGSLVAPSYRLIPDTDDQESLLRWALSAALGGLTTAEEAVGFFTPTSATPTAVESLRLSSDGEVTVEFNETLFGVQCCATTQGMVLQASLHGSLFQFDFVETVTYTLYGDCTAFAEHFESECSTATRSWWEETRRSLLAGG